MRVLAARTTVAVLRGPCAHPKLEVVNALFGVAVLVAPIQQVIREAPELLMVLLRWPLLPIFGAENILVRLLYIDARRNLLARRSQATCAVSPLGPDT